MKPRISKTLLLPMLYGILAAWLLAGTVGVLLLAKFSGLAVPTMMIAVSALILLAVCPAMVRAAWVYSNLRRHHTAEYFYNLGNGQEPHKAVAMYERRVGKAVSAWLQRMLLRPALNLVAVVYLFVVMESGQWLESLWVVAAMALLVVAVEIGVWTMLFSARKLSYDKYGNLKNN